MNWNDSQMAASAFAKGHGGMSLGQQWGLAGNLQSRKNSPRKSHKSQLRNREPRRAQRRGYGAVNQTAYLLGRETNVQDNRYGK